MDLAHLKKHISFTSNKDIKEICDSFFKMKRLEITHLNYIHKCHDGSVFYLCSNYEWLIHYFNCDFPFIGAFEKNEELSKSRYVLWSSLDGDDKILRDSKNIIGVEHGITVIQKTNDGYGYYNFGNTQKQPSVINTYINNLDILNEFVIYFQMHANAIMRKAKNARLILPYNKTEAIIIADGMPDLAEKTTFDTDKLYINDNHDVCLSPRELNCIDWYLKGKNSADISLILNISRRTVETHIENAKSKLCCVNLCQLGYSVARLKYSNKGYIPHPYK